MERVDRVDSPHRDGKKKGLEGYSLMLKVKMCILCEYIFSYYQCHSRPIPQSPYFFCF